MRRSLWVGVSFGALAILSGASAHGALTVYESFDYPAGAGIATWNGGTGLSGSWAVGGFNVDPTTSYGISAGTLNSGALVTAGNRATTGVHQTLAGVTRSLSTQLGAGGTTKYLSVLLRPEGQLNAGAFNGFLGIYLDSPDEPDIFIGKPGAGAINQYVVENRGGAPLQSTSGVAAQINQTALLVLRATFNPVSGQPDTFALYVNPGPTEPPVPLASIQTSVSVINALTLYSTGAYSADEIRIGDTFADVVPVPEPSVLGLGVLGVLVAIRRRRVSRR